MNAQVQALLRDGELDQAIGLMNGEVRNAPTDVGRRSALVELLCISGNLERADTLLDSVSSLDPSTAVGIALYRQLVRAEQARQQFYADGRLPEFLAKPNTLLELELKAAVAVREGSTAAAVVAIQEREEAWAARSGRSDKVAFDDFRDLDDLSAAHLEVFTSTGKYYWVALENVASLSLRPIERRRDMLWRRAHLSVEGGPDGEVFLPAIYVSKGSSPAHRLGYATDFVDDGGLVRGVGLRSFLVGDDSRTVLELSELEFDGPVSIG